MTPAGAVMVRELATRLSASMLARIKAGTVAGGWLHAAVRDELAAAHAAGLSDVDAVTAVCAVLLGAQAEEVRTTLAHYAARLDRRSDRDAAQAAAG